MTMKLGIAIALTALMLAGCAERATVADEKTQTVAASSGSSVCADLTAKHLLILAQGTAEVILNGSSAVDLTGTNASLQSDLNGAPSGLAVYLSRVLGPLQDIQTRGTGDASAIIHNAASAAHWCAANGYLTPELGVNN